jgi:hypothetical protein
VSDTRPPVALRAESDALTTWLRYPLLNGRMPSDSRCANAAVADTGPIVPPDESSADRPPRLAASSVASAAGEVVPRRVKTCTTPVTASDP